MNKILLTALAFATGLMAGTMGITQYNEDNYRTNNLLYDANVTSVRPVDSIVKTIKDANLTSSTILNKRSNITPNINVFNDGSSVRIFSVPKIVSVPEQCFEGSNYNWGGGSAVNGNVPVSIIAKKTVHSFDKKAAYLQNSGLTSEEISRENCIEVWVDGSDVPNEDGGMICGDCAAEFSLGFVSMEVDQNGSQYYTPDNAMLAQAFAHMEKSDKSSALIQKMYNKSVLAAGVTANNLATTDTEKKLADNNDSKEAQIVKLSRGLVETAFLSQLRQRTIKCFVKRELVPRFYCPIPGKEGGAQTGGSVEDDLTRAKERCDSYCKSDSYPCKEVNTGRNKNVNLTNRIDMDLTTASEYVQIVNVDEYLLLKKISYDINVEFQSTTDNNVTFDLNNTRVTIPLRIEYIPQNETKYIQYSGSMDLRIESLTNYITLPEIPNAQTIRLRFYQPRIRATNLNYGSSVADILTSVNISNFKAQYYDDKFYFCSKNQIITTPSQCLNGEVLEIESGSEQFLVCSSESRTHGPEPRYGAYYTSDSCNQGCVEERECVETFAHFSGDVSSPAAYKTTVGCVDDPQNNSMCSVEACENKFRNHAETPIQEVVYDTARNTRMTVAGGVQVNGAKRPKILIDDESDATTKEDYEIVFLNESKDQAYLNMINDRTFNYSNKTLGVGQPQESACRINKNFDRTGILSSGDESIYWKLKPNSKDIGNGSAQNLYKIAVTEQVYVPASGMFVENGYLQSKTMSLYKDYVYSYITPSGLEPFYIKEYHELYQEGNVSAGEPSGWTGNSQHNTKRYISYDVTSDRYMEASSAETAKKDESILFNGNKNYYEYTMVENIKSTFDTLSGGNLHYQEVVDTESSLPIKHYSASEHDEETSGAIINYHLYGIYSSGILSNSDIVNKIENENDKYLVYRASRGRSNKSEIKGDGAVNNKIKIFVKGTPDNMTLSADIDPRIKDEGKDVVMFMFTYEEEN